MTARTATPEAPPTLNLGNLGMGLEQAIEMEKASLATFVSLSSYAIDLSRSASLFSPIAFSPLPGDYLDVATKLYASFLDLQMCWLHLLMPQAGNADASSSRTQLQITEHGMDVVVGASAGGKS